MWNEDSNSHDMSQYAYRQIYQQMAGNLMQKNVQVHS